MSKHTDQKWCVEPDGSSLMVCTDLLEICTIQPVDRGGGKSFFAGGETVANAFLISAAPELLEALEACLDYGSMTGDDWVTDKARAAIAKAKG